MSPFLDEHSRWPQLSTRRPRRQRMSLPLFKTSNFWRKVSENWAAGCRLCCQHNVLNVGTGSDGTENAPSIRCIWQSKKLRIRRFRSRTPTKSDIFRNKQNVRKSQANIRPRLRRLDPDGQGNWAPAAGRNPERAVERLSAVRRVRTPHRLRQWWCHEPEKDEISKEISEFQIVSQA